MSAAHALRHLLDPVRRSGLGGLTRRHLDVTAVWPDGFGFCARLESPRRPGHPAASVRWRDEFEIWPFPEDPALPGLATLATQGWTVLGYHFAQRATLLSPDGDTVAYLRPAHDGPEAFERLGAVSASLKDAGLWVPRFGPPLTGFHAMCCERVRGTGVVEGANGSTESRWCLLGEALARAHQASVPVSLPPRGIGVALQNAVRQIGLTVHSGESFPLWLERRFERWGLLGTTSSRPASALVHGDLGPADALWSDRIVILGWHQAGAGHTEEDLGSLAAWLYREQGPVAAASFAAVKRGYMANGPEQDPALFAFYARLAMLRILALQAMSETERPKLQSSQETWAAWPEIVSAW